MEPVKPPRDSEVTPEALYLRRREFIKSAGLFAATTAAIGGGVLALTGSGKSKVKPPPDVAVPGQQPAAPLTIAKKGEYVVDEALTPLDDVSTYNNFYEFGLDKGDPAQNAHTLRPRPWTVEIAGEVDQPRRIDLDALIKSVDLEERIYRMRCVEAWSMVIPWLGFPLSALLKQVEPTSAAKFVAFTTLYDTEQMPGQKQRTLDWPYVEGLRLDEAMHPLTLMAVGLYGKSLPNQNGAPLRLVTPWKYGFKGIKSIVKIELVRELPPTTWNQAAPGEYGFYANVNPDVPHPRWSQASERRIGELTRRKTLPFNGYGDQVASLYTGMDLKTWF